MLLEPVAPCVGGERDAILASFLAQQPNRFSKGFCFIFELSGAYSFLENSFVLVGYADAYRLLRLILYYNVPDAVRIRRNRTG